MKAYEIIDRLFALSGDKNFDNTCDTIKAGNPDVEVDKVAISMFATVEVINQVKEWGAQLLIVHEPLYYNHWDNHTDEKIECEKRKIIENSGITVYRFHDHPHAASPDIIAAGQLNALGLGGTVEYTDVFDLVRVHLDKPITPKNLARKIEEKCKIKHIRICGAADAECTVISCMFGQLGGVLDELKNQQSEIVITGETCEWNVCEYVRDAAQLGCKKSLIVMGHIGSEREGMKYVEELLKNQCPQLYVRYFECGEVYTYTD